MYDADALVTDIPGFALCMKTADCVPVILVDRKFGVIGIAHNGWRGIIRNINSRVVDLMIERGARKLSINAYIGPAIRACCYKVYGDRRRVFEENFSKYVDRILVKQQDESVCLDLVACVKIQLQQLGILPENITDGCGCTKCTPGLPSYQRTPVLKHKIISLAYIAPERVASSY
jgi:YfiH family protein